MPSLIQFLSLIALVALLLPSNTQAQVDVPIEDIFDNDSEFMRGFETGLFLRTKGGTIDEYGCAVREVKKKDKMKEAFEMIKSNIDIARASVQMDPVIDNALKIVVDIMDTLTYYQTLLSKEGLKQLDQYCTGMVFGLHGSQLLVKMANTLINPVGPNGEV